MMPIVVVGEVVMKFLIIDGALMRNKVITAPGKLIISYIYNLERAGKCYFGGVEYLADVLGLSLETTSQYLHGYFKHGLLRQDTDGIRLNHDFSYYTTYTGWH